MFRNFHKITFYILALTFLLTAAACRKYLEVQPISQLTLSEAYSTVANATSAILGVYDELQGDNGYGIRISQYYPYDSDEMIVSGTLDFGRRDIGRYRHSLSNTEFRNPFVQLYRGVEKANLAIEQIPQMRQFTSGTAAEKTELRRLLGEVMTLRAQFFFELIRNWGDVPAPFIPAYRQADLLLPQANRDSTYDRLISDLDSAESLVQWRFEVGTRNERITKGAIKALRARLALYRGGYSLRRESKMMERRSDYLNYYRIARDECWEIMQRRSQSNHDLNPSFEGIWRSLTSFQPDPYGEIIFEVGAGGGNSNSDSRMGNYSGPAINSASRYGSGGAGLVVLPNYFYAFDSTDTRRDVTITIYQIGQGFYASPGWYNFKNVRTLIQLTDGKFRRDWRNPLLPGEALNVGYNWPLIRFADVLLMFAEAENELNGGPTAEAYKAVNEVRRRAFGKPINVVDPTVDLPAGLGKDAFFNAIVQERYLEFGGEGIRKYDLIRWNLLGTKLQQAREDILKIRNNTHERYKIPQYLYWRNVGEEIEFSNGKNPFYYADPTPPATSFKANSAEGRLRTWGRTDWRQALQSNSVIDGLPLHQAIARFYTPNKSELFPFDQATMDAYRGRLQQNPNY